MDTSKSKRATGRIVEVPEQVSYLVFIIKGQTIRTMHGREHACLHVKVQSQKLDDNEFNSLSGLNVVNKEKTQTIQNIVFLFNSLILLNLRHSSMK